MAAITINKRWLIRRLKKSLGQFLLNITQEEYDQIMGFRKERKTRTPKQRAIDVLDKMCSEYVRKRAMLRVGGCEKCHHKKLDYKELQWAHYIARGKYSTRWNPDNAAGLCPPCHMYIDNHPVEKLNFFYELLGKKKVEELADLEKSKLRVDKEAIKRGLAILLGTV